MQPDPIASTGAADRPVLVLYFKPDCPWCAEVISVLEDHAVPYRGVDVSRDVEGRARMEAISGQAKAPTLDWGGDVLADFGIEELLAFLRGRNVHLENA